MCRHIYDWNIVNCDVKQSIQFKKFKKRQYEPVTIEMTLDLVLGLSTALYRPFLKHCTLTRRWGLYDGPCPNFRGDRSWSFVSQDSFSHQTWGCLRTGGAQPTPIRMSLTMFVIYNIYYLCCLCIDLYDLSAVWLLVCCLYNEVYLQMFKCVSFWLHGCCGEWEGGPVNRLTIPVGWL